ncbi:hypothetical protein DFH11DRAFT_215107 [Phellopilus nigrolimitatus]|nr:hypothetical protein DFH11DRAFT_215107 [Phellopilus nigrolimitatus]
MESHSCRPCHVAEHCSLFSAPDAAGDSHMIAQKEWRTRSQPGKKTAYINLWTLVLEGPSFCRSVLVEYPSGWQLRLEQRHVLRYRITGAILPVPFFLSCLITLHCNSIILHYLDFGGSTFPRTYCYFRSIFDYSRDALDSRWILGMDRIRLVVWLFWLRRWGGSRVFDD